MFPMSAFQGPVSAVSGRFNWDSPPTGNQSPFSRQAAAFDSQASRFTSDAAPAGWGSAPESSTAALTSSVVKALGAAYQVGFEPPQTAAAADIAAAGPGQGNKSGASSRRHSVSVVGGPGGRRDFFESSGFRMTSPVKSARWTDAELLPDKFDNALNLDIDRRGSDVAVGRKGVDIPAASSGSTWKAPPTPASSVPTSALFDRPIDPFAESPFGSSPARGRVMEGMGTSHQSDGSQGSSGRLAVGGYEQPIGSPARSGGFLEGGMRQGLGQGQAAPGPIGAGPRSAGFQPSGPSMPGYPPGNTFSPFGAPFRPSYPPPFPQNQPYPNFRPQMEYTPLYPGRPYGNQGPPQGPPRPPYSPTGPYGALPNIGGPGIGGQGNPGYGPPAAGMGYTGSFYPPSSPPGPLAPLPGGMGGPGNTSPGFSTLSLADLGKGVPLASLAPNTPLYIVVFKAGRRDVYYCPDPTSLISNGDRVIVEADRGSDLGTVIYDQLTPIDVRDWQESQATKALLSGAREHLPPGMVQQQQQQQQQGDGPGSPMGKGKGHGQGAGSFGGHASQGQGQHGPSFGQDADTQGMEMDLSSLLSGCGPTGASMEVSGAYVQRGPLAKEVMPKRIFAKSAQGAEEQAYVLFIPDLSGATPPRAFCLQVLPGGIKQQG